MENLVEIFEYNGPDYDRTMKFGTWCVAYLNYSEGHKEGNIKFLERHNETDEVFVLLTGTATLLIDADAKRLDMEPFKIYNVKKSVWHNIILSEDAKILIVENNDTGKANSDYMDI